MKCYYLGCWNEAGHFLHRPGGWREYDRAVSQLSTGVYIDGAFAPRRMRRDRRHGPARLPSGALCWLGMGKTQEEASAIDSDSSEYPQGQFLVHHLDNGYTAMAWWDRCQGDSRGACNSTILLEGTHTAEEMVAALREHFPHVAENLARAGVELVEVKP